MRNVYKILVGISEERKEPKSTWEDNIKRGFYHRVQNDSGAHPASYPMGTGYSL
jgi:hypothetical protein